MSAVAPAPAPILDRLRAATAAQHARVEAALPLLAPGLTLDRYRRILAALYGYYRPLEPALWAEPGLAPLGLDARERRKAALLAADLAHLGVNGRDLKRIADAAPLPRVDGLARALGALYVLEGATLGGRVIARHLARTLRVAPERGASFFAGYGAATGRMWTAYRASVTEYLEDGGDAAGVAAAAAETFETMERWLVATA